MPPPSEILSELSFHHHAVRYWLLSNVLLAVLVPLWDRPFWTLRAWFALRVALKCVGHLSNLVQLEPPIALDVVIKPSIVFAVAPSIAVAVASSIASHALSIASDAPFIPMVAAFALAVVPFIAAAVVQSIAVVSP
jgi:hypothetical protein